MVVPAHVAAWFVLMVSIAILPESYGSVTKEDTLPPKSVMV